MILSLDKPTLTPTPIPVPPPTPIPTRHTQKSTNIRQISTIVCQQKGSESLKTWDGQSRSVPLSDPTKLLRPQVALGFYSWGLPGLGIKGGLVGLVIIDCFNGRAGALGFLLKFL